jgi:hypothetical protein
VAYPDRADAADRLARIVEAFGRIEKQLDRAGSRLADAVAYLEAVRTFERFGPEVVRLAFVLDDLIWEAAMEGLTRDASS